MCREIATKEFKEAIEEYEGQFENMFATAMDADNRFTGFCIICGNEQNNCEPDAWGYQCEECGENTVGSFYELTIRGLIS